MKNFAAIVPYKKRLLLYLNVDPSKLSNLPTNARDVTNIGHWATGHLEVSVANAMDFEAAKPLIRMAYEGRAPSGTSTK